MKRGQARALAPDSPLHRLPDIDYSGHPLYEAEGGRVGVVDRAVAYARYAWILGYVLGNGIHHRWTRRPWVGTDPAPHVGALRRDGLVQLRTPPDDRSDILGAARPFFDRLQERRAGIERGRRTYPDGQLDTTRDTAPELFAAIERAFESAGILPTVRAYLGCRAQVRKVTMQMNDEWDGYWREHFEEHGLEPPPTAFFHVDNTYGVVKVILYASDVTETSGPFSYVLGTHRIAYGFLEGLTLRATDIWVDMWPRHRELLLALPPPLRRKAKFGDDVAPDSDFARWLLANERFATSEGGDLLLFDVMGIHRGGLVRSGERRIIQIMMR